MARRYVATPEGVRHAGTMDGAAYEKWVAGFDEAGDPKGRLRHDDRALRFVEAVVNGPKRWSLAASLHAEIAAAYDAAQRGPTQCRKRPAIEVALPRDERRSSSYRRARQVRL